MVWKSTHWGLGVTAVAWTVTVMVLDSNGYGVEEHSLGSWRNCCSLDSNGYGVGQQRLWCGRALTGVLV
jgi:hypothetical protein